jgi:GDPmannose 4,6-dehydratase
MNALITGITGQDGFYLAEFLLKKGYKVYGMHRRTSMDINERLGGLKNKITLVDGDLTDMGSLIRILRETTPDEVYNLGAQSFVPASWTQPISTADITAMGVLRLLESIRIVNPKIKFYQASSSEMFGKVAETPQNEKTPFYPRSPYGVSKVFGYYATINYRESYNMFACNGILFNHESPRRGRQFVTRKITYGLACIKYGLQDSIALGNLDAKRDWGYAGDYIKAMWLMLQQGKPDDYVIATGETHTVREFVEAACKAAGMSITWEGKGLNEVGKSNGKVIVKVDPSFYRPAEVEMLLGNAGKAKKVLGWKPSVAFKELAEMMMKSDLELVKKEAKK